MRKMHLLAHVPHEQVEVALAYVRSCVTPKLGGADAAAQKEALDRFLFNFWTTWFKGAFPFRSWNLSHLTQSNGHYLDDKGREAPRSNDVAVEPLARLREGLGRLADPDAFIGELRRPGRH